MMLATHAGSVGTCATLHASLSSRRAHAIPSWRPKRRSSRTSPVPLRVHALGDDDDGWDTDWDTDRDSYGESSRSDDTGTGMGALDNPIFNDNFKKAFMDAQERIADEQGPMKAQIRAEVDAIMKQVQNERTVDALESALPLEEEEEVAQEVAQVQKELVEKEIASTYADALDNPLFTDNFKQAFIEAQARLKEEQAPMREKIDEEVAAIMRQVHAEREAEARGETYTQTADDPLGALDAFAGAMSGASQPGADTFDGRPDANANANANQSFKSPPPRIESTQTESLPLDADILGEMLSASDAQLGSLRSALAPLEKALRSEIIQNRRIRIAIDKAQRTARYAEADRIAAERRAERDRLEREGKGNW